MRRKNPKWRVKNCAIQRKREKKKRRSPKQRMSTARGDHMFFCYNHRAYRAFGSVSQVSIQRAHTYTHVHTDSYTHIHVRTHARWCHTKLLKTFHTPLSRSPSGTDKVTQILETQWNNRWFWRNYGQSVFFRENSKCMIILLWQQQKICVYLHRCM